MVEPTTQHLYIMQNEHGLIKIGRSVDVYQRRTSLQKSERCRIEIVEVFKGCGDLEESWHIELADHRLLGEWFDGHEDARAAVVGVFGLSDEPPDWPFSYDREGADKWLSFLEGRRWRDHVRRQIYRVISILRQGSEPSSASDQSILRAKLFAELLDTPKIWNAKVNGKWVVHWIDSSGKQNEGVPCFSSDVATAMSVWPDDARPAAWSDTPIACCIAALTTIMNRLPRS